MNSSYKRYWEPSTPQVLGSSLLVGALATYITYPLDVIKTRIQQRAEGIGIRQYNLAGGYNPNKIFREMHETGLGLKGMYHGVETAIIGRSVYLIIRNIIYKTIYDRMKPPKPTNDLTMREKAFIAGIAGGVATLVTNPVDVILTRQQVDLGLKPELRRNYGSFMEGYGKVNAEAAGAGLWKGLTANLFRAVLLNFTLSLPYNDLNEKMWNTFGDTYWNRPVALVWATTVATTLTLPFDNIKTRFQLAWPDASRNRVNYENFRDCFKKIAVIEGPSSYFVGFNAYWCRTFFYSLTTIYAMDLITNRWKRQANLKPEYF